jgi:hypothetical protein
MTKGKKFLLFTLFFVKGTGFKTFEGCVARGDSCIFAIRNCSVVRLGLGYTKLPEGYEYTHKPFFRRLQILWPEYYHAAIPVERLISSSHSEAMTMAFIVAEIPSILSRLLSFAGLMLPAASSANCTLLSIQAVIGLPS